MIGFALVSLTKLRSLLSHGASADSDTLCARDGALLDWDSGVG